MALPAPHAESLLLSPFTPAFGLSLRELTASHATQLSLIPAHSCNTQWLLLFGRGEARAVNAKARVADTEQGALVHPPTLLAQEMGATEELCNVHLCPSLVEKSGERPTQGKADHSPR